MSEDKRCCLCDEELCCADDLFEYNDSLFCFNCLEIKLEKEKGLNTHLTTTYFDKENEYLGDDDDIEGLYQTICRRYDVKRISWEEKQMSNIEKCKLCGGVIETIEEGNEVVKVCVVCGCPYDCTMKEVE